ncbi:SDR family NAD(P)-dependent oxidoreductase [Methylomonas rapida]|uniref:3-oxoacyl-ACP reductase FabG n=1 Tax=Methylomonas rapida TaxID=2963939 RepID=A0ABY7GLP4_9GAMM|nr:3-oxoacyl-ACP reductase family protein [Methylomonas rapida]WAR45407.1 3-oxoacyl-ACP reductase FabG [Methylomonas rapida]
MSAKVVLVTGASRGIGRAIAQAFIEAGYKVAVGYHHHREPAESLAENRSSAIAVRIDVSIETSVKQAIAVTEQKFGSVDVLVNNAGIAQPKPFLDLTDSDWEEMFSVNLLGAVRCTQHVLPAMLARNSGRIINIASIGGQTGGVYQVHYAATKAGLINFTKSLSRLYSHQGITANAISPGLIATDMIAEEMQDPAAAQRVRSIPAARLGSPEEVASLAVYLASYHAGYITGQTINVNGGMYFG